MVYKFFDKKTGSSVSGNEQGIEELHKTVIKKFKRRRVYARFKENIWAAHLAEMELFSKNKNEKIKDKNVKTVLNAFIEIVNESNRKSNKLWVDQGKEFYNKLMQE